MAIRRLNYTGRKRLHTKHARITVRDTPEGVGSFDADLDLSSYDLPLDALVFVEAYRPTSWMRFGFGTVGSISAPTERCLSEFDNSEAILFRVRVTSASGRSGLLLAEADRIRAAQPEKAEDKRIPLLWVDSSSDLGEQVFRVDFSDRTFLLVNSRVGDRRALVRQPAFLSLVLPAVFREVLARVLYIEKCYHTDDPEYWGSQWLRYATLLPGVGQPPGEEDKDGFDLWIDEAVAAFCRHHRVMEHFSQYWTREAER